LTPFNIFLIIRNTLADRKDMTELDIISTLDLLNVHLAKKRQVRSFIICGGAALILQKIATRTTQDIDIVAPEIDQALKQASEEVAKILGLNSSWLNSDPIGLADDLAKGWKDRVIQVYTNTHLKVFSISREDMIFAKFYAYCDRQKDIYDLVDLAPTSDEIERAANLTMSMDANVDWPAYVEIQKHKLKKRMMYE
jgi:hypothetical protein